MIKIEHIGIAVENLEEVASLYEKLFNKSSYKEEDVETEGVKTSFYQLGESKIELLSSIKEESPIEKYINKKGPGIHHIAFEVDDINQEMSRLREEGFQLINDQPKKGADNKLICFIHPKTTGGVLVELCQEIR